MSRIIKFYSLYQNGGFPGWDCKESACNAGDLGSVPRSRRSPGEGLYYPLQYSWASLVALLVKNLPAMWETWVQSLGSIPVLGRSPGEGKGYPLLSLLAWRILWIVTRATNPPQSWKFKYNFIVGRPYPWFWIPQFNQAWIVSSCASYLSEKKSTYQWVRIVQTCVVQRSTVIRYEEVVYYYYFILCCFDH